MRLATEWQTITGLSGSRVWLVDVTGAESSVALAELLSTPGFRMVTRPAAVLPPQGLLDSLPAEAVDQARWWERHIIEVITGVPPEAGNAWGVLVTVTPFAAAVPILRFVICADAPPE